MISVELYEILDENIITIGLEATDKDDALRQMSQSLYSSGYIDDLEVFIKDIYLREKEGVTGIGNGVAIPHGKSESAQKIGLAVATLRQPIEWETLDDQKVDLIFLFCVSTDNNFIHNHLVLLSRVAAKIANEEMIMEIKECKTKKEIVKVLGASK